MPISSTPTGLESKGATTDVAMPRYVILYHENVQVRQNIMDTWLSNRGTSVITV
jgi:hypothetical protein